MAFKNTGYYMLRFCTSFLLKRCFRFQAGFIEIALLTNIKVYPHLTLCHVNLSLDRLSAYLPFHLQDWIQLPLVEVIRSKGIGP